MTPWGTSQQKLWTCTKLHDRNKPQGPWADSRIIPLITEVVLNKLFCCTWGRGIFFPWPCFHPEFCFTLGPNIFRMCWWCLVCQTLVKRWVRHGRHALRGDKHIIYLFKSLLIAKDGPSLICYEVYSLPLHRFPGDLLLQHKSWEGSGSVFEDQGGSCWS